MRKVFTTADAARSGISADALRWGERAGRWRRIDRGVYGEGPDEPSDLDRAIALVVVTGGVASGCLAGVLHELDGVELAGPDVTVAPSRRRRCPGVRRRDLPAERVVVVRGVPCTDGLQTLVDLASLVDDLVWEHAFESALRKHLVTIDQLERVLPELGRARTAGHTENRTSPCAADGGPGARAAPTGRGEERARRVRRTCRPGVARARAVRRARR